ncbi:MAG: 3-keto-5-aminohexanoate cleavage protein [Rubrivivax sp.]
MRTVALGAMAIAMGLHVRCGIEDNLWGRKGERITSVRQVERQMVRLSREPASRSGQRRAGPPHLPDRQARTYYRSADETLARGWATRPTASPASAARRCGWRPLTALRGPKHTTTRENRDNRALETKPHAVLIVLLAIHAIAYIDRNMLLGFSPQITRDLALSNAQYGFLAGAGVGAELRVLSFMAVFMGDAMPPLAKPHARVIAAGILVERARRFRAWRRTSARWWRRRLGAAVALVPAAVSLLMELFKERRASTAAGVFFMGIPLGIGLAFNTSFYGGRRGGLAQHLIILGAVGVAIGLPLLLLQDRREAPARPSAGAPSRSNWRTLSRPCAATPPSATRSPSKGGFPARAPRIRGFVVHPAVARARTRRRRRFDRAPDRPLADRLRRPRRGGRRRAQRPRRAAHSRRPCRLRRAADRRVRAADGDVAPRGGRFASLLVGLCAGFFLPLATYGPSLALVQGLTPAAMRSTVTGFTMLLINVFAIAIGKCPGRRGERPPGWQRRRQRADAGAALHRRAGDFCRRRVLRLTARGPRVEGRRACWRRIDMDSPSIA